MELEIRVMWCRGLSAFNFFQKLSVYAAVSIISEDQRIILTDELKQEQKTPIDEKGDGNPEWDYTVNFDLKSDIITTHLQNFTLLFELRNHGQLFGDKNIGEVRVPLKDLIESVGFGVVRFASYEVRNPDGKPNGILDFAYKVGGGLGVYNGICSGSEIQITGYNNHNHDDVCDEFGLSESGKIEYPKIELEELNGNCLIPSLVGGEFQYNTPSTTMDATTTPTHYPPPCYPPHGPPLWAPQRPENFQPPPLYPPPPPPESLVYPPQHVVYPSPPQPPTSESQPYGDPYTWRFHRPPPSNYHESNDGYGNYHW